MKCLIRYVKASAILYSSFVQHKPPSSWLEEEDRDEQLLNELKYLSLYMAQEQGENVVICNQVLNNQWEVLEF